MGRASQPEPVAGVEPGRARHNPGRPLHRLGSDRIIVRRILEYREFRAGLWLLGHHRFMLGQGGFAADSTVGEIVVGQRAGDRPGPSRRTWLPNRQSCPVVGMWGRSVAGGARADGGQCGWWEDAGLELDVLVVAGLVSTNRRNAGNQDQLVVRGKLHDLASRQKRTCGLLARYHEMAEPGR